MAYTSKIDWLLCDQMAQGTGEKGETREGEKSMWSANPSLASPPTFPSPLTPARSSLACATRPCRPYPLSSPHLVTMDDGEKVEKPNPKNSTPPFGGASRLSFPCQWEAVFAIVWHTPVPTVYTPFLTPFDDEGRRKRSKKPTQILPPPFGGASHLSFSSQACAVFASVWRTPVPTVYTPFLTSFDDGGRRKSRKTRLAAPPSFLLLSALRSFR